MDSIKSCIKKYKIIPCLVMVAVMAVTAYLVKWYRYGDIAGRYGQDVIYFYRYYDVIALILIISAVVVYYLVFVRKSPVHKIYLAACICLGIAFTLIITPNAGADETNHLYHVMGTVNRITGAGDTGSEGTYYARRTFADLDLDKNISVTNYIKTAKNFFKTAGCDGSELVEVSADVYNYSPAAVILYLPAIIGILAGRITGLGGVMTYTLARLLMLVVYSVITYTALKKIPVGKNLLALIMLLPMMTSRVVCISEDCVLYAVIFLYMAYVMNAVYSDRTIRPAETVVMVCAGVFMSAFKGGIYIPLLLLLFMIPKRNFGEKVKYPVVVASAILLAVVTFAAVNFNIFKDVSSSTSGSENELMWTESEGFTLRRMFTHPKEALCMLFNTFFLMGGTHYAEMFASGFGWLQIYTSGFLTAGFTVLMVLTLLNCEGREICFNKKQRIISLSAAAVSIFIIVISMWIFWTPAGSAHIVGLQGRYFIPLLFCAVYPLKNSRCIIKKDIGGGIIFAAVMFHALTFWEIYIRMAV